jgi:hypothetical protein
MRKYLIAGLLAQSVLAIAQTAPVSNAPILQPLKGLYVEQRAIGANFAYAHYYFWSDGRYCLGLPSGGLDGDQADFAQLKLAQPCGQYRLANEQLTLLPQDGAPVTKTLSKRDGDRFLIDGNETAKVPTLPANQSLEGQYSALVIGSQMNRQSYVFRADGTYRFISVPITSADGSPASSSGTYKLVGNTLVLNGEQAPSRLTAYPVKQGQLMIEGTVFAR